MKDISQDLKIALDLEKNGYNVYMKAAAATSNALGKATLTAIAEKELDHIKAIEEFSGKISSASLDFDRAIKDINPKDKADYIRPVMAKLKQELKAQVKPDSDLEKAYKIAMGLEKDSFNLYKKLAGGSDNPQEKKFFEFLMGEENTHFELLEETLQYLNKPADWFKDKERWIVEG
jgi:rubrerythrin